MQVIVMRVAPNIRMVWASLASSNQGACLQRPGVPPDIRIPSSL